MKNLKTISFTTHIGAARGKVWNVLWDPDTYRKWTSVFMEGSHYAGDLKEGQTIRFLGNETDGMSALVEKSVENEQMVFLHQNEVKNGEVVESSWQGSREIYYLKETGAGTELQIIIDITPDMEDYFHHISAGAGPNKATFRTITFKLK